METYLPGSSCPIQIPASHGSLVKVNHLSASAALRGEPVRVRTLCQTLPGPLDGAEATGDAGLCGGMGGWTHSETAQAASGLVPSGAGRLRKHFCSPGRLRDFPQARSSEPLVQGTGSAVPGANSFLFFG